jgi:DNA-binding transcriptional LysR family regulator
MPRKPTRQPSVTYEQARALVTLARTHSFERTATLLGLGSATSVFHLIGRMGATIARGPLVGPSVSGQVQLTAIGNEVLPQAMKLVDAYGAFVDDRHEIRLSCYPSVAGRLARTIAAFNAGNPQVEVVFYEVADQSRRDRGESLLDRTTTGEIDLVVAPSDHPSPELKETPVYGWKLRVILPEGDRRRSRTKVGITDLTDLEFVASPLGHSSRRLLDAALRDAPVRPRIVMELVDQYVLERLAREGTRYAAVMPDDAFGEPDPSLGPALVDWQGDSFTGNYSLYYANRHVQAANQGSTRSDAVIKVAGVVTRELKAVPSRRRSPEQVAP